MANNKGYKKSTGFAMQIPECPVCLETMVPPIYQCKTGHSICGACNKKLPLPICPSCREDMTRTRNTEVERLISKISVQCPNKEFGCKYRITAGELNDHITECIFRNRQCPMATLGRCLWVGRLDDLMKHFTECHPTQCDVSPDNDVAVKDINLQETKRFIYLATHGKFKLIITLMIDPMKELALWTVQVIAPKKTAQQFHYKIHVISDQDSRRQYIFNENCFSDALTADDIMDRGECAMIPLKALNNYTKIKTLTFRFGVRRDFPANKNQNANNNENNPSSSGNKDNPSSSCRKEQHQQKKNNYKRNVNKRNAHGKYPNTSNN